MILNSIAPNIMFEKCKSCEDIDLDYFDESKAINFNKAFQWLVGGEWPTIFDEDGNIKQDIKEKIGLL